MTFFFKILRAAAIILVIFVLLRLSILKPRDPDTIVYNCEENYERSDRTMSEDKTSSTPNSKKVKISISVKGNANIEVDGKGYAVTGINSFIEEYSPGHIIKLKWKSMNGQNVNIKVEEVLDSTINTDLESYDTENGDVEIMVKENLCFINSLR